MAAITNLSPLSFSLLFGAVSTFIVTTMCRDWLRKKRAVNALARRPQHADEQFGRLFASPSQADIAVRARRVLSKNLEMPLGGLALTDRLNDDLHAELEANPHLFWDLETEFGIKTTVDVEDLESHEKTLQQLLTFQNLVEYIETQIAERPVKVATKSGDENTSSAYRSAIKSIPVLCLTGLAACLAGALMNKSAVTTAGAFVFLSGFIVWGTANGSAILRALAQTVRELTWKELRANPWSIFLLACVALSLIWFAVTLAWALIKTKIG